MIDYAKANRIRPSDFLYDQAQRKMARTLAAARQELAQQDAWTREKRTRIAASLARLDHDFDALLQSR